MRQLLQKRRQVINFPNVVGTEGRIFIYINSSCQYFILYLSSACQLLWDRLGWAEAIIRHMTSANRGILWMYLYLGKENTHWTRPKVRLSGIFRIVYLLLLLPTRLWILLHFYTLPSSISIPTLVSLTLISALLILSGSRQASLLSSL